jgi:hypothetical protein
MPENDPRVSQISQLPPYFERPPLCYPPPSISSKVKNEEPHPQTIHADDIKLLKQHSKAKTPVAKIAKQMKRSEGSLRQKALALGIGLGHQR